jgi:hypothetical protein
VDHLVEALSAHLHTLYQHEAQRQGDVLHPDDYTQLAESTKDYDRVLARFILKHAPLDTIQRMLADDLLGEDTP